MTTLTLRQLRELRECAKQSINKTIDQVFDIIERTLPGSPQKKMPPGLWPPDEDVGAFFATIDGNHLTNDSSLLKKPPFDSKQSIFESILAEGEGGTSSADSGGGFSIFNSDELKKIFEKVAQVTMTPDEGCTGSPQSLSSLANGSSSDCDCDYSQNSVNENDGSSAESNAIDSSSQNDLMAEIHQKVFATNSMPSSKLSSADSKTTSPTESLFIVPFAAVEPSFGPITPPKKLAQDSSEVSFAKVAAANAAKSPTKTVKAGDPHLLTVVGKPDEKNLVLSKNSDNGDNNGCHPPPQQSEYNHQFRTKQVKCFVGKCEEIFSNMPMLSEHLKRAHRMLKNRCPLVDSCGQSFEDPEDIPHHMEACHSNQVEWKCEKCPDKPTFPNYNFLGRHHYFFHQKGIFVCKENDCAALATNRGEIIAHCKTKHGQGSTNPELYFHLFKIHNYSKYAKYPNSNHHMKNSPANDDHHQFLTLYINCLIPNCLARLRNQEDLNDHLEKVHGKFPILCPIYHCRESFKVIAHLDEHMHSHASENMSIYFMHCSAPQCSFVAREHRQLSSHIYWLHNKGLFKCSKCSKTGKYRNEMTTHYSALHK